MPFSLSVPFRYFSPPLVTLSNSPVIRTNLPSWPSLYLSTWEGLVPLANAGVSEATGAVALGADTGAFFLGIMPKILSSTTAAPRNHSSVGHRVVHLVKLLLSGSGVNNFLHLLQPVCQSLLLIIITRACKGAVPTIAQVIPCGFAIGIQVFWARAEVILFLHSCYQ